MLITRCAEPRVRPSTMLIIAITGMPGAGKSTVAQALEGEGFVRIAMGDMIREETGRRGLYLDDKNMGMVMREMREKYGAGAVAELCLRSIQSKARRHGRSSTGSGRSRRWRYSGETATSG